MLIPSDEIPQADILSDVLKTVVGVSSGISSYQEIARYIEKVGRQGRYYRKAAEIIGLIETPTSNSSVLTPLGVELLDTGVSITNPIFINAILNIRLFQRLIPFLELNNLHGLTRNEIIDFIILVSDLANTMAIRRVSSVVSWLEEINIVEKRDDRYFIVNSTINDNVEILHFTNIDEPLLPRNNELLEYQTVTQRAERAQESILIYRDMATTDRADNAHRNLVNIISERIKLAGQIPRYNQLIDLATKYNGENYIFEMKSITEDNVRKQLRSGLSQLYEYQYLQNLEGSNLVLVIEKELPISCRWMIDYLENNRNIYLIWDGDDNLYGTAATTEKFNFLDLIAV